MRARVIGRAMAYAASGVVLLTLAAQAQMPPYPPPPAPGVVPAAPPSSPAAAIASCLCLNHDITALGATMSAKRHAYDDVRAQLDRLDARLERERRAVNVNDPDAVARFRQLLGERDAMFHRSTGPIAADLAGATSRYNSSVNEYNARCANQPQDPALVAQVRATLSCPAPY